jgi:general secretion pathway protein G
MRKKKQISDHACRQAGFIFQIQGKPEGFTLIELLIVVAIIGILTTLVLANLIGVRQRARDAQRKADLRQLQSALELYRADVGSYPTSPLPACGSALTSGGSTYMQKIPCDPLNTGQYVYTYTSSTGTTYTIVDCLENVNDPQKDSSNDSTHCTGGSTNWSFTVTNP